jgi:hypothetical protein
MINTKAIEWAWKLVPLSICIIAIAIFKLFEPMVNPVIADFRVNEIIKQDGQLVIRGEASRRRGCDLDSVNAAGYFGPGKDPEKLNITFANPNEQFRQTATGLVKWGPWEIRITDRPGLSSVDIGSVHNCTLGKVKTQLASLPATYIDRRKITLLPGMPGGD